jgi:hypothetical protein
LSGGGWQVPYPRATRLNALPKYVASTTLDRVPWHNSILLRGDVVAHIYRPSGRPHYGSVAPGQEGDVVTDPVSRPAAN